MKSVSPYWRVIILEEAYRGADYDCGGRLTSTCWRARLHCSVKTRNNHPIAAKERSKACWFGALVAVDGTSAECVRSVTRFFRFLDTQPPACFQHAKRATPTHQRRSCSAHDLSRHRQLASSEIFRKVVGH